MNRPISGCPLVVAKHLSELKLDALPRLALGLQRTDVSELPLVLDGDNREPERFKGLHELIAVGEARSRLDATRRQAGDA